ncbi:GNAT family N-acetyltransferase [Halosolutus halophilus]|uniref:GNAT family N-acetyltransferase n=1 Tax=Halosolutus halophilus TaxID=1552990 RepID=UPI0022350CD4|nr:GNAT family N-acetyltransferase [Halosolutus halophilus]
MTRDLVTTANENLRRAFGILADEAQSGESRRFGPLTVASAGVPAPFFNRVFAFDAPPLGELSAAVAWMAERDVPFWVTVTEPTVEVVESHPVDLDLVKAAEQPGMAMATLDEIPPRDSVAEIAEVTDSDERDEFSTVTASAFEWPLDVVEQVDQAALAADDVRLFLGRVDGHPAASGLLIQSGHVAGVYSIGVVEEFRRRGIGEAMSWEVLQAGREAGCQVGVLQSSEMGYPLYERMGFETVVTYHHFEPAIEAVRGAQSSP